MPCFQVTCFHSGKNSKNTSLNFDLNMSCFNFFGHGSLAELVRYCPCWLCFCHHKSTFIYISESLTVSSKVKSWDIQWSRTWWLVNPFFYIYLVFHDEISITWKLLFSSWEKLLFFVWLFVCVFFMWKKQNFNLILVRTLIGVNTQNSPSAAESKTQRTQLEQNTICMNL